MNIKLSIYFFAWLIVVSAGCKRLSCKDYKVGKFTLTDKNMPDGKYTIERNDSIQIENNLITGSRSAYRVTWINDCEYNLKILEGSEQLMKFYTGKLLVVRIVEIYDDGYKFESRIEGIDRIFTQILKRVDQKLNPETKNN